MHRTAPIREWPGPKCQWCWGLSAAFMWHSSLLCVSLLGLSLHMTIQLLSHWLSFHPVPSKVMLCLWFNSIVSSSLGTSPLTKCNHSFDKDDSQTSHQNSKWASPNRLDFSVGMAHCHLKPNAPKREPIGLPFPLKSSSLLYSLPFIPSFSQAQKSQAFWTCLLHRQLCTTRRQAILPP